MARFRAGGVAGLQDRSSRPDNSPLRTSEESLGQIVEHCLRRWTCRRIAIELEIAQSTVGRLLRTLGLKRLSADETGLSACKALVAAARYYQVPAAA